MRATRALAVAGAALALAACGTDDQQAAPSPSEAAGTPSTSHGTETPAPAPGTPTPESPAPESPAPEDPGAGLPPFPTDTELQFAQPAPRSLLLLTDVRVGRHDGFDRVVMEFRDRGSPGWSVNYVDRPRADGSGERIPVRGDAYLDVYASGTTYEPDGGDALHGSVPTHGGVVEDVFVVGTFEGATQVMLGVDGGAVPFRVLRLADPPRLVVDVRAAS